jgi:Ni,Fe-hydrogenase maturation factor
MGVPSNVDFSEPNHIESWTDEVEDAVEDAVEEIVEFIDELGYISAHNRKGQ